MAKRYICPKCQHHGLPGKKKRGSSGTEAVGWMILFPLGVPYTLWRMFTKIKVCRMCGHEPLIDEESPTGQRLLDKIYGLEGKEILPEKTPLLPAKETIQFEKPQPRADKPWQDPNQF